LQQLETIRSLVQEIYLEDPRELARFLFGYHEKQTSIFERVLKSPKANETIETILQTAKPSEIGEILTTVSRNFKKIKFRASLSDREF
jgi:hypothetical protein